MEPTHMNLSAFDWATVIALAGLLWFLLVRDFNSRDKLAETVGKLVSEVEKLRGMMAEKYVTKVEHLREIERLEETIADYSDRWRDELDTHRKECPVRRP